MISSAARFFLAVLLAGSVSAYAAEPVLPYFAAPVGPTGAAVVIVPHDAFTGRDSGSDAATAQLGRWLADRGIAAFVFRESGNSRDTAASVVELNHQLRTMRAAAAVLKISPTRIALLGLGRGAEIASIAAYAEGLESRPMLLGLIGGGRLPADGATKLPPTFLVGSSARVEGGLDPMALWTQLRVTRTSVDLHLLPAPDLPASETWREMFFHWARFGGLLTAAPRLALNGMVYLDGHVLPHGYVILTPVGFAGAGPIVCRVINSTAGGPIGEFTVPAEQGPVAGRYHVNVRQNMNRWLSNSFSGGLVQTRGGAATPEQLHFGHHRVLSPSIDDQHVFTKARPTDAQDYAIEIQPGADANLALKIEVFSK